MVRAPLSIYVNWASYDELSDAVELTEELALAQLRELERWRACGARLDAYLMDAFWYAPEGGYREWRKPHWPHGPDRWLEACGRAGVLPGLWFSGNTLCKLKTYPAWRDSVDADSTWRGMCLFHGGFLPDFLHVLRGWYGRGIRLFKLDFFSFAAAPLAVRQRLLPSEIRARNVAALREGLAGFKRECPEAVILGYNGFEEAPTQDCTDRPFACTVDPDWLQVFDSLYCGDPRPADVPAMDFWRSKDIYTDHMVRVYERNGFPLAGIDNAGFMIGNTGTCYYRRTAAWKGMLILSLARGGWINTYYGNLELLDASQVGWLARVQALFFPLQAAGGISTFGAVPGEGQPYGYVARSAAGALYTVVNPSQALVSVPLPGGEGGRLLFHDAGYTPVVDGGRLALGPEQMALVGTGEFSRREGELGIQEDVEIPTHIARCDGVVATEASTRVTVTVPVPQSDRVRIVMRQRDREGMARRTKGGAPPGGITLGKLLCLEASQQGRPVALRIHYDKAIWSGLSWAVAEFDVHQLQDRSPVTVVCSTLEPADVVLAVEVYSVRRGKA